MRSLNNGRFPWIICSVAVFTVIALFYAVALLEIQPIVNAVSSQEIAAAKGAGEFGDSTAVLNTFFSALAFGGVIITIIWQISNTRKQTDESKIAQFENVYFNMTQTFETIVSGLSKRIYSSVAQKESIGGTYDYNSVPLFGSNAATDSRTADTEYRYVKGRDVFEYVYRMEKVGENGKTRMELLSTSSDCYDNREIQVVELQHYFRYMYRIIKYIDSSNLITLEQKYEYAAMFRAQLSCYELVMLFYDGLSEKGDKFKKLIEKYAFFNNIEPMLLAKPVDKIEEIKEYKDIAFDSTKAKFALGAAGQDANHRLEVDMLLLFAFLYVVAFVFIEKWDKYVVDVILSRFPDADFGFLVFLIALLVILLYCVYKHLRPWKQRTVRWFSPDLMIAYNIILSSVIVWLTISSEYVWHGYGCFAYALLIPVASAGYLAEYMLYVRFCNKRSGDDMLSYTSGKYQQNENSNTTELNTKGQNVQTGNVKTNKEQINKRKKNERKRCKRRK